MPKLIVKSETSSSVPKYYYLDYTSIMNGMLDMLERQPSTVETVLRHNDGKTLKFFLRHIFFIMSIQIDCKGEKQVIFRNT